MGGQVKKINGLFVHVGLGVKVGAICFRVKMDREKMSGNPYDP
jgi:hypothetical protein